MKTTDLKLTLFKDIKDFDILDNISIDCVGILENNINGSKFWIEILNPNEKGIFLIDGFYTNNFEIAYITFLEYCLNNI